MEENEEFEVAAESTAAEPEAAADMPDEVYTLSTNDPDSTVWIRLPAAGTLWVALQGEAGQAAVVHEGEYTWITPGAGSYPVDAGDSLTYSIRDSSPFFLTWGYESS